MKISLLLLALLFSVNGKAASLLCRLTIEVKNVVASPQPGAYVSIDDKPVGVSDDVGKVHVEVPAGDHKIIAYIPSFALGTMNLHIQPDLLTAKTEILLQENDLKLDISAQKKNGILPLHIEHFRVVLRDYRRKKIPIQEVLQWELKNTLTQESVDLRDYFILRKGSLVAYPDAMKSLQFLLDKQRDSFQLVLRANVVKFVKRTVFVEESILLGRYSLKGKLLPPPGQKLEITYSQLRIRHHPLVYSPDIHSEYYITTKQDGTFELPFVPFGYTEISSETHGSDPKYLWSWRVRVQGNSEVTLQPESLTEVMAGVLPVQYVRVAEDTRFTVLKNIE